MLISQTLSEKHFHNSIVVNAKIKFSKHSEYILEICIGNNKYFPPTHFSIVKDRLFKKVDQENYRSKWYTPLFLLKGLTFPEFWQNCSL